MSIKKILVTGHHGYIGAVMAPYLKKRGYDVVGLDADFYDESCALQPELAEIPSIKKDLRDTTADDLDGVDAIVHLAAICNDPLGNLNGDWTYDINHRGTVHLAKLAKQVGAQRFLLSSSCSMHGKSTEEKVTEETPVNPITPYGESKIKAEQDLGQLADESFVPTYLRNGTVYGISPRHRLDIVLNNLVGWAATTGQIRIMSDGTPWRPVVHIEDVCQAFAVALEAPADVVRDQAFHVGGNHLNYQIAGLAEIVKKVVPHCDIELGMEADADQRTYIADFSKIERLLPEFKPQWDAERGAGELYQAYKDCGLQESDMTGDRFIRLNRIKKLIDNDSLDETLRRR